VWPILLLALAAAAAPPAALDVPYLTQSEDLCGGAAAAMVFRYWGDRHADPQLFAPLVDARAGGIATDRLVDFVEGRGWRADVVTGSVAFLEAEITAGAPVVVLLQVRPHRYHYVVVVAASPDGLIVHDPAVGPSRHIALEEFIAKWQPANHWAVVISPLRVASGPQAPHGHESPAATTEPSTAEPDTAAASDCDRRLAAAVAQVKDRTAAADAAFGALAAACPASAGPLRELAGIRFAQERWHEAAALAERAVALDPHDRYAWDVLGSSRFMLDDDAGALDAWNHVDKPRVDLVRFKGAEHVRSELLARIIGLAPNAMLTDEAFRRAERRLSELPGQASSRLSFRPDGEGFAVVDVAVAERPAYPHGTAAWAATAARMLVDREADVAVPGPTGQGEVWDVSWRWWKNRPRAALALTVPRVGWMPGIWRVDGSWEQQAYGTSAHDIRARDTRAHAGLSVSDWLSGQVRYEISGGVDSWNGRQRTISAGAGVQRRLLEDRIALFADASAWFPVSGGDSFRGAGVRALYNAAPVDSQWLVTADAGVDVVSGAAPRSLWPGAGDGHGRPVLLRAHPLLDDGVVAGPAFGRTLAYGSVEAERWIDRGRLVRFGWAAFADAARAWRGTADGAAQVDVGVGLRIRVPGTAGAVRLDVARGVRDGARAISVAWQR